MAEFDYVVVGGGSAGCVLAARLSEDPTQRVCLVEAGPSDASALVTTPAAMALILPTRIRNWAFQTVPQGALYQRRGYQPRGRMLGGSSSMNAMIYMRGHPSDYDDWAAAGADGWAWQDVLPYFLRAENNERGASALHGVGGPLNVADLRSPNPFARLFVEAGKEAGLPANEDFNGPLQEGVGLYQVTQKDGERCSAARAYLHPAMGRPNLAVYTEAHALRVLFEGRRATGVEVWRGGRSETLGAVREVVLTAGAFQSPQLLMCSGIGPAEQLRALGLTVVHDAPGVGENLQDHPDYVINRKLRSTELFGVSLAGGLRLARELLRYARERRGMLTTNFAEAGGFAKSEPGLDRPDLQLHFVVGIVDNHNRTLHLGHGLSCHVCALRPKSRGTVRLASSDARDAPLIDPHFVAEPEDLATLVRGFKLVRRILDAPALAAFPSTELYTADVKSDADIEQAIRARADTVYHPVGTCRMGSDARAVLDSQLRVRGVERLRVADCSVMPSLIGGNTNAPAIMIGERAAEFMRRAA
ncbi:MAG: GMC family oxidoreductase N-terminal domain-containing protein [Burkholderiales bacterium]